MTVHKQRGGWYSIAWAFLKLRDGDWRSGRFGQKVRLQLYSPPLVSSDTDTGTILPYIYDKEREKEKGKKKRCRKKVRLQLYEDDTEREIQVTESERERERKSDREPLVSRDPDTGMILCKREKRDKFLCKEIERELNILTERGHSRQAWWRCGSGGRPARGKSTHPPSGSRWNLSSLPPHPTQPSGTQILF